jgi:hypothetical protein
MKSFAIAIAVVGAAVLVACSIAFAKGDGLTMAEIQARGWTCFPSDFMFHCVHPDTDIQALFSGQLASVPTFNFANPDGEHFLGTEILIRADLGDDGRPCHEGLPLHVDGTYEARDFNGDGVPEYYACHHNDRL